MNLFFISGGEKPEINKFKVLGHTEEGYLLEGDIPVSIKEIGQDQVDEEGSVFRGWVADKDDARHWFLMNVDQAWRESHDIEDDESVPDDMVTEYERHIEDAKARLVVCLND